MTKIAFIDAPRATKYWGDGLLNRVESNLVAEALSNLGVDVEIATWYEDNDWEKFSHLIVRTPSDVYFYADEFLSWLESVSAKTKILNTANIIKWNLDKHYLGEFIKAGVNVAPTSYIEVGETFSTNYSDYVVKPVTSGGGANSGRFSQDQVEEARELISRIHNLGVAAIVQPYLTSVDERGEIDLVFFNEVFDHAIIKGPVLKKNVTEEFHEEYHPNPQPYTPSSEEILLAEKALSISPTTEKLLHARIDMATDNNGNPSIIEVEYLDPVLFLDTSPGSVERYAQAIASRII